MNDSLISDVEFTEEDVWGALCQLKPHKSDCCGVTTEHLKYGSPVLTESLASLFTSIVRHGYMPQCLRDSVLVPIPKGNKDPSNSQNYRAIALASSLSKVLERLMLDKYSAYLYSCEYQFGFKSGFSTSLCTGIVKNVVSRYIHNGSAVLGCFLDASKAFDMVDHATLFSKTHRQRPSFTNYSIPIVLVSYTEDARAMENFLF